MLLNRWRSFSAVTQTFRPTLSLIRVPTSQDAFLLVPLHPLLVSLICKDPYRAVPQSHRMTSSPPSLLTTSFPLPPRTHTRALTARSSNGCPSEACMLFSSRVAVRCTAGCVHDKLSIDATRLFARVARVKTSSRTGSETSGPGLAHLCRSVMRMELRGPGVGGRPRIWDRQGQLRPG